MPTRRAPLRHRHTRSDAQRRARRRARSGACRRTSTWQDQTGAPDRPAAGQHPGRTARRAARRRLQRRQRRHASASPPTAARWTVAAGPASRCRPTTLGGDAASVFYVDDYLPSYFEIQATINAAKPIAGWKSNAYMHLRLRQSPTDFKFAGVNISTNKIEMGHRDASRLDRRRADAGAGQAGHRLQPAAGDQRH